MTQIKVDELYEQDGAINGFCTNAMTIIEALRQIYPYKIERLIKELCDGQEKYILDRYRQLIVVFRYNTVSGMTLNLIDLSGDTDIALDDYLDKQKIGWTKNDLDKAMRLFMETKEVPKAEVCRLVR